MAPTEKKIKRLNKIPDSRLGGSEWRCLARTTVLPSAAGNFCAHRQSFGLRQVCTAPETGDRSASHRVCAKLFHHQPPASEAPQPRAIRTDAQSAIACSLHSKLLSAVLLWISITCADTCLSQRRHQTQASHQRHDTEGSFFLPLPPWPLAPTRYWHWHRRRADVRPRAEGPYQPSPRPSLNAPWSLLLAVPQYCGRLGATQRSAASQREPVRLSKLFGLRTAG